MTSLQLTRYSAHMAAICCMTVVKLRKSGRLLCVSEEVTGMVSEQPLVSDRLATAPIHAVSFCDMQRVVW